MKQALPWGKSFHIDLIECDSAALTNEAGLKRFIGELIKRINMVAHGPCYIDKFGDGPLYGMSAMQFIKTSSITVHCDDKGGRAFVDIFSCKDFDTDIALEYTKEYFGSTKVKTTTLDR